MDASALRWTLAIIGIVLLVGIYLYGLQQNRLRKRTARDTFTREEIDSAFIEDQQLRDELNNIGEIISTDNEKINLGEIKINPAMEADLSPVKTEIAPLFIAEAITEIDPDMLISHFLMRLDSRLLTGDEIHSVLSYTGIEMNAVGLLEYHESGRHCFTIASLSDPGHFSDLGSPEFTTLGRRSKSATALTTWTPYSWNSASSRRPIAPDSAQHLPMVTMHEDEPVTIQSDPRLRC